MTGADILISIGAYVLYWWIKDYFESRRAFKETEVVKQQDEIVAALIQEGFRRGEARTVTVTLLDAIAKRSADDLLLKSATLLIGKN